MPPTPTPPSSPEAASATSANRRPSGPTAHGGLRLDDAGLDAPLVTPGPVGRAHPQRLLERLHGNPSLDDLVDRLGRAAAPLGRGRARRRLGSTALGHPLHPALTDLPIGCWTSAMLLDLIGGRNARTAARRLIGLGVLFTVPTALSGLSDLTTLEDQVDRRTATVHAVANGVATMAFARSWWARARHRQTAGIVWATGGAGVSTAAAYLGGHLALKRRPDGSDRHSAPAADASSHEASGSSGSSTTASGPGVTDVMASEPPTGSTAPATNRGSTGSAPLMIDPLG